MNFGYRIQNHKVRFIINTKIPTNILFYLHHIQLRRFGAKDHGYCIYGIFIGSPLTSFLANNTGRRGVIFDRNAG